MPITITITISEKAGTGFTDFLLESPEAPEATEPEIGHAKMISAIFAGYKEKMSTKPPEFKGNKRSSKSYGHDEPGEPEPENPDSLN